MKRKLLLWTLGLTAAVMTLYVAKPGNAPEIKNRDQLRHYGVVRVYGGGEKSVIRAEEAAALYRDGRASVVNPLGRQYEIDIIAQTLRENGVPDKKIVLPPKESNNTIENILVGEETSKQHNLGDGIANVSGEAHLKRIAMLNKHLSQGSQGYFGVDDGFGEPIWKFPPVRDSDMAAYVASLLDRIKVSRMKQEK